jgi:hypothetical protein
MRHTLSCTIPAAPPLVAGATTFAPIQGALWVLDILVNLRVEQQRRETHTTGLHPWGMPPLVPAAQKGGKATGDGSFPPTGIYYRLSQMRHVPIVG